MENPDPTKYPTFVGRIREDGSLVFDCDCGKTHEHSNGTGLRVSHCKLFTSYFLISPDDIKKGK